MAKGGVHVVVVKEPDHPPAEPDAFGMAGRAADLAGGFGVFVPLGRGGLLAGLVGGLGVLCQRGKGGKQQRGREQCSEAGAREGGHGARLVRVTRLVRRVYLYNE